MRMMVKSKAKTRAKGGHPIAGRLPRATAKYTGRFPYPSVLVTTAENARGSHFLAQSP